MSLRTCGSILALVFLGTSVLISGEKDSVWNITAPHGASHEVAFDTDEGTWMSVDVSPDGKTIVFDLLGDLYTVPAEGGRATLLRGGPAFEAQPRFSPDGRRISFTSDRDGADNIWVMNANGSDARAVTKERVRLLNNAVWTPDGQYLIARKHFVNTRSLGAGEMWMYHVSGGDGVQVTKRRDWQHDAGEPSVSPDGRYLYYSQDVSPGSNFEYNRDPYGTIYAIDRADLQTGRTERFVNGAGGSVRPQISPDGRWLAFVRRVRLKTVLFLHDVQTGEEWPLFDGLDQDGQETWSIFGVYPGFAWMPDGKSIIVSGKGKIWRVDIASGSARMVPFTAHVSQQQAEAVRFGQDIAPPTFDVKMIRWPAVAPDRKSVVYVALGHLYRKRLPDGLPERITSDAQFEYYPALSPDGKWIAYTAWTDSGKGALYRVKSGGGRGSRLTSAKGTFVAACYSPDGTKIVFRKAGGDALRGSAFSHQPGIYWIPSEGGEMHFITDEGSAPRWSRDGERILLTSTEGENAALVSVDMNGGNRRVHLTSENAQEIAPSPDGRWIAFVERYNAYIAAFPSTGQPIHVGPSMSSLPLKRISTDAGSFLQWSADSRSVSWSLGPALHVTNLSSSFDFLGRKNDDAAGGNRDSVDLTVHAPFDRPNGIVALTGATVISMKGDEVIEKATVVIDGNRIAAVGPAGSVSVPPSAKVLDMTGRFLIPGLIDVHAHGPAGSEGIVPEQNWAFYTSLAFGVTTEHDPSNDTYEVFSSSEMVKAGEIVGPRIFSTGTILYGAEGSFKAVINSLDDARSHLRRLKAVGAFSVKSYNQPRRDQRQQVLEAARELRMMVVPEGGSTLFWNITQILDGHTGIEHSLSVDLHRDVVTLFGKSGVGYTPTLIVGYGGLFGENYWYAHSNVWENERLLTFMPRSIIDARSRRRLTAPEDDWNHMRNSRDTKAVLDAGGHVQLGAHGQLQGLGAHWELWMFVQGGFTPLQALRAATLDGARYLGLDKDLGSIEAGKLADIVVLEGNPLEDIRQSTSIQMVIANGRIYDGKTMNEIGENDRKRAPFFWQDGRQGDAVSIQADAD
jgi:Tol biopolymer transport system component/imidazolonepropionase-like amidohydrolase